MCTRLARRPCRSPPSRKVSSLVGGRHSTRRIQRILTREHQKVQLLRYECDEESRTHRGPALRRHYVARCQKIPCTYSNFGNSSDALFSASWRAQILHLQISLQRLKERRGEGTVAHHYIHFERSQGRPLKELSALILPVVLKCCLLPVPSRQERLFSLDSWCCCSLMHYTAYLSFPSNRDGIVEHCKDFLAGYTGRHSDLRRCKDWFSNGTSQSGNLRCKIVQVGIHFDAR